MTQQGDLTATSPSKQNSSMLFNLALNVILPSVILTKLSDPSKLGPVMAFWLALAFPLGLGIWEFIRSRKFNFFSGFGLLNVALTGGLGFLSADGFWFAVKEAAIPLALGIVVLVSIKTKMPLVQTLLFNEAVINMPKIKEQLNQNGRHKEFESLVQRATLLLAASFFMSATLNFALARIILKSPAGTPEFNVELGKMTALSFPVIALPVLAFTLLIFFYVFTALKKITSLSGEDIFHSQKR
ncbi:MAG: hypothetical protein RLZZ488_2029 [Pseudomonadota bacterium]